MTSVDPHSVTVTVVYDGPAYAGKTTSVRALAQGFGREAVTPGPANERTQYYDWFEYTGGRFDGASIRCQVVSVPGQPELAHRRGYFIARADVVVFVADTTREAWAHTKERLLQLRAELTDHASPIGLVFQANKRDDADAVPLAEISAAIGDARTVVFESVARDGVGVREAFVFAIRLALDRVRDEGASTRTGNSFDHGPELVALLERLSPLDLSRRAKPLAIPAPPPLLVASTDDAPPRIPAPWEEVLSGFVWPPVDGRIVLHQAAPLAGTKVRVTATGDYYIGLGSGWRVHASGRDELEDLASARAGLIAWARQHTAAGATLSRGRCLVVSQVAPGRWRLWQLVQHVASLRERLGSDDEDALTDDAAAQLVAAVAPACRALELPCTYETIGVDPMTNEPAYIGLSPSLAIGGAS